jgi:hypothetical protein
MTTRSSEKNYSNNFICSGRNRIRNDESNNSSIVVSVRCSGKEFTEPLPRNDNRIHL